jgi:hypothetical protein
MTFQPVVPFGGLAGWQLINRTLDVQQKAFDESPAVSREVEYFRENIGNITTAEELVADRTLRKIALGAFGLDEDIDNRFFIRKVLEDGTLDPDALSNRLADKRYLSFSEAFGFGDSAIPSTLQPGFAEDIVSSYQTRQIEIAVGAQQDELRLAFTVERDLLDIASGDLGDDAKWFTILGNAPLRSAFETALGLPSSFVSLDLDQQLGVLRDRMESFTGNSEISQFAEPEAMDDFVQLFLVQADIASGPSASTPGSAALTLLSQSNQSSLILQTVFSV